MPNSIVLSPIPEPFFNNELSQLKINKSPWSDGIHAKFLKDAASEIKGIVT